MLRHFLAIRLNLPRLSSIILTILFLVFLAPTQAFAATSPTLGESRLFSVLGGAAVTNVGTTTTTGAVGVSPGTSITGGTINASGGIHSNDASAIAAQADTVSIYTALDQTCTNSYSDGQDLTLISPLVPGVYCSAGSFLLTGNLTLSGTGVWIFKTVSTLITSPGSSVTSSDPCNVWWRIGSAATLDTTTSFVGNIVTADVADTTALNTGATLNGRVLAQAAQTVTLAGNTITTPTCTSVSPSGPNGNDTSVGQSTTLVPAEPYCPPISDTYQGVSIIDSERIDSDSISLTWGPFTGGVTTFNIQYGTTNGEWLYNSNVSGFSTTINDLPQNQPIWVRIAARSDCTIGDYNSASQIGVYTPPTLVGSPRLPNTGAGPDNLPFLLSVLTGTGLSVFLVKYLKKNKASAD